MTEGRPRSLSTVAYGPCYRGSSALDGPAPRPPVDLLHGCPRVRRDFGRASTTLAPVGARTHTDPGPPTRPRPALPPLSQGGSRPTSQRPLRRVRSRTHENPTGREGGVRGGEESQKRGSWPVGTPPARSRGEGRESGEDPVGPKKRISKTNCPVRVLREEEEGGAQPHSASPVPGARTPVSCDSTSHFPGVDRLEGRRRRVRPKRLFGQKFTSRKNLLFCVDIDLQ